MCTFYDALFFYRAIGQKGKLLLGVQAQDSECYQQNIQKGTSPNYFYVSQQFSKSDKCLFTGCFLQRFESIPPNFIPLNASKIEALLDDSKIDACFKKALMKLWL